MLLFPAICTPVWCFFFNSVLMFCLTFQLTARRLPFHLIVVFSFSDYVLCPFFLPAPSFACSSCTQTDWTLHGKELSPSKASTQAVWPFSNLLFFYETMHFFDEYDSLVAIFSEGHGGIPCLTAHSCAPLPTKKLKEKKHILEHL